MANNYVEASFMFDLLNKVEEKWWEKEGNRDLDAEFPEGDLDPEDIEGGYSSNWAMEGEDGKKAVWFSHDESIDVESAAAVIQRFLKECRPEGSIGFCWAETCSKPRLDNFGGGACFITAEKIEWNSAAGWIEEQHQAFQRWGKNWVEELAKANAGKP